MASACRETGCGGFPVQTSSATPSWWHGRWNIPQKVYIYAAVALVVTVPLVVTVSLVRRRTSWKWKNWLEYNKIAIQIIPISRLTILFSMFIQTMYHYNSKSFFFQCKWNIFHLKTIKLLHVNTRFSLRVMNFFVTIDEIHTLIIGWQKLYKPVRRTTMFVLG